MNKLTPIEFELMNWLFYKGKIIKYYAEEKEISYSYNVKRDIYFRQAIHSY